MSGQEYQSKITLAETVQMTKNLIRNIFPPDVLEIKEIYPDPESGYVIAIFRAPGMERERS